VSNVWPTMPGRTALEGERVEAVERTQREHPRPSALRRLRIDVVKVLEPGRVFQVAEQRQAMPPLGLCRARGLSRAGRG
jgi:hypothetical protein